MSGFYLILILAIVQNVYTDDRRWLPKGVTEIDTINASATNNVDFLPFVKAANKAAIFAIGESAHGVAGFQSFQFRLSKYLISNFGYRRILSEILSDDILLNNYLQTGQGNLTEILYTNPWHGDDQEMYQFFEWIATWNAQNPNDVVTVHVVDPQAPWLNAAVLRGFFQTFNEQLGQSYLPVVEQNCFGAKFNNQVEWAYSSEVAAYYATGTLPQNETSACFQVLDNLTQLLQDNKRSIIQNVGFTQFGDAFDAVRSLRAWEMKSLLLFNDTREALRVREAAFGPSVLWQWRRNNPEEKPAILIAHHLHVSKNKILRSFVGQDEWFGLDTVGRQLERELGDKYVVVGQSGYNVSAMFQSRMFPSPNSTESIDFKLKDFGKPWLLLKTNVDWVKNQESWYVHEERVINGRLYKLESAFDFLVFHLRAAAGVWLGQ